MLRAVYICFMEKSQKASDSERDARVISPIVMDGESQQMVVTRASNSRYQPRCVV